MTLNFYKYQGTGNDFILIDDRDSAVQLRKNQIARLCDRHFGIGADGLMLLRNRSGYDFEMVYYNADGGLSSLCGNGSRCITAFALHLGIIKDTARFMAADGPHLSKIISQNPFVVALQMKDVDFCRKDEEGFFIDTGSPHLVTFRKDYNFQVVAEGRRIRNLARYKSEGVNVNFVCPEKDFLQIRTYERGVEDETLSCGTGVTAAALVAVQEKMIDGADGLVRLQTPGGSLTVRYQLDDKGFREIWLEGPAGAVFQGTIDPDQI